jgi:SAM-dependent methyltransferase
MAATPSPAFHYPPLNPGEEAPVWVGNGFQSGGKRLPYLDYNHNEAAWDDSLTQLHDEEAGGNHYIDVASRRQAVDSLRRHLEDPRGVVLEVGISSGLLLPELKAAFPGALVLGADAFPDAVARLAERNPTWPMLVFDLCECPLPDDSVDAVVMLNVLEHIERDQRALEQVRRILKPGGVLVIEVPSGSGLYDIYDELLHHFRRYDMGDLRAKVERAGLTLRWTSHLGFFLYPAFATVKKLNHRFRRRLKQNQEKAVSQQIRSLRRSTIFDWLMGFEFHLGRLVRYPFGIRCLVAAVKTHEAPKA